MLGGREFECAGPGEVSSVYSNNGDFCPIKRDALLKGAQLTDSLPISGSIAALVAYIIVIRTLGYFALKLVHTSHKPKKSSWRENM